MTVISSKEFATKPARYYRLAQNEQVFIKRGKNMYHLTGTNGRQTNEYDEILEPDDDLRRAITIDEFRILVKEDIHQIYSAGR